jgi:quercetin dioxygenase-like cupin family protein
MSLTDSGVYTVLTRAAEGEWRSIDSGVSMRLLRSDQKSGASAILLKFEASSTFPIHNHPGGEEVYVLEGDVQLGADLLNAGDYLYTPPGGKHPASSRNGCLMLVITPKGIEVLGQQP